MPSKRCAILLTIFLVLPPRLSAADGAACVAAPQAAQEEAREGVEKCEVADSLEKFLSRAAAHPAGCQCDGCGCGVKSCLVSESRLRAGWWQSEVQGSPGKIGLYQDLDPSPFWSWEHFCSDGTVTNQFSATGLDLETSDASWGYFGPGLRADVDYQRYLSWQEHDPLLYWPSIADASEPGAGVPEGSGFVAEDLNAGEDYVLRVQQLKAGFKGELTEKVQWRLNVWSLRKSGERQSNALANCFDHPDIAGTTRSCHVLSRRQQIDWLTTEVEPAVESKLGPCTISFSWLFRSFNQNDQSLSRLYNNYPAIYNGQAMPPQLGSQEYPLGADYPYGIVPENFTQMRKLKIGADLAETTHLYSLLYHGTTDNEFRDTRRNFAGFDLRLTDRTLEGVTLTGFAKMTQEKNHLPAELISGEELEFDQFDETEVPCPWWDRRNYGGCGCEPVVYPCVVGEDGVPDFFASDAIVHPIDYDRTTAGFNGRSAPFRGDRSWKQGLAVYGGYEFRKVHRGSALSEVQVSSTEWVTYDQADTSRHQVHLGLTQRWGRCADTFIRYKVWHESDPLFGVRGTNGMTNTSLPTDVHLVEIGGTWSPVDNFMANATWGIENRSQHTDVADFDEDDYPLSLTLWYRPTCRLSLSAGYVYNSNWIDQTITLGDDLKDAASYAPVTRIWDYGGRNQVYSLGGTYAWTPRLRLRGDVRYVRGNNAIDSTVFDSPYVWPEIAEVARDVIESIRISAGLDCLWSQRVTGYFRYSYLDYEDELRTYENGTAHLFLAGVTGAY